MGFLGGRIRGRVAARPGTRSTQRRGGARETLWQAGMRPEKPQEKGGREVGIIVDTFRSNPVWVANPTGRPGPWRKRSLASRQRKGRATKRRQPVLQPCYSSPRAIPAVSPAVARSGGHHDDFSTAMRKALPAGGSRTRQ